MEIVIIILRSSTLRASVNRPPLLSSSTTGAFSFSPRQARGSLFGVAYRSPPPIPETSTTCPAPLLRPRATELPTVVIGHWVRRPVRRSGSRSRRSGRASGVLHATSTLTPGSKHLEPRYAAAREPDILGARFRTASEGTVALHRDSVYARHFGSAPPAAYLQQSPGPNNILTTLVYVLRMHLVGCEVVGVPIASRNAQDENTCSVGRRTLPAGSTTAR